MEEKKEEPSLVSNKLLPILCEECKINSSKYKCPGCSLRSCSLACVNSHKKRTACTGKRTLTNFVPMSQFDDNLLISDYNMLEDVKRIAESAQRMRTKLCGYSHFRLPFPLRNLKNAASKRRMKLLFLSSGMSKRQKNKSYYDNRKKLISWTIEWRFHATNISFIDHGIHENATLSSVIENHLKPGPWNHPLRQFCDEDLDSLKFFIRKYPKGSKSPFVQLNIRAPIREQLVNTVILEYPLIHVFLPSHTFDFDVIKLVTPNKLENTEEPASRRDSPAAKGVTFKEEEIEDAEFSEPLVSDLMNRQDSHEKRAIEKEGKGSEWDPQVESIGDETVVEGKSCIEQLDEIGDSDFDLDFDPDVNDLCSELMGTNGDEVFYIDGCNGELFMNKEELEEGEIS